MLRRLFIVVWVCLLTSPLLLFSSADDFGAFFSAFQAAVEGKKRRELRGMMNPQFDFIRSSNVSPEAVFQGLEAENGQQWKNLQDAVHRTPVPFEGTGPYANSRVLQCTPNARMHHAVSCLVIFQPDGQNRWRWRAMIMPSR